MNEETIKVFFEANDLDADQFSGDVESSIKVKQKEVQTKRKRPTLDVHYLTTISEQDEYIRNSWTQFHNTEVCAKILTYTQQNRLKSKPGVQ